MNKICTTIKQSKKLVELGIDPSTADMCWCNNSVKGVNYTDDYALHTHTLQELKEIFDEALNGWDKYWEIIPAWSLSALLELLDDTITDEYGNDYFLEIHKEDLQYYLLYHDRWGREDDIETEYYDDLVDACCEMIIKLKERNLL